MIKVSELQRQHPEYRADLIAFHQNLYEGGQRFRDALKADKKGEYLSSRALDGEDVGGGRKFRDIRIGKAQYASEISRIIGNIISTSFKRQPTIVATGADAEYFSALNDDCDGAGTDFSAFLFRVYECGLNHRRAYVAPTFPDVGVVGDLELQRQSGALDGKLRFYSAADVDLWAVDMYGIPLFYRVYRYEDILADGWRVPEYRLHTWSFINRQTIETYTFRQEYVNNTLKLISDHDLAQGPISVEHGYGSVPVSTLSVAKHFWVADKLSDGQIALFNSEADERFVRSQCAHPVPVITGDIGAMAKFYNSEVHANVLPMGSTFQLVSPDSGQSTWHESAINRERANMYAALDAMKLYLASQPQNARQSAAAKSMDSDSATSLIAMFASSLRDCALQALRLIAQKRGRQVELSISGLDVGAGDAAWLSQQIAQAQQVLALNPPEAARRHVVGRVMMAACADAPQDTQNRIIEELNTQRETASAVEINGAVAEGLLNLVGRLMTPEEARVRIGLPPALPAGLDPMRALDGAPENRKPSEIGRDAEVEDSEDRDIE